MAADRVEPDLGSGAGSAGKSYGRVPVPMNLFGSWEVDRSTPSCVQRVFSLTLKKLFILRELDRELSSIVIAVKLQDFKRTLRSNEYFLPLDGRMETDLELSFSLQYPHFLKRDSNCLYVMLQKKRRYKNRTIGGYKTLAVGIINMSEVMQHPSQGNCVLGLYMNFKDTSIKGAELSVHSLSSQPIEQEYASGHHSNKAKATDRSPDSENWWDDDDDSFSSEQEGSDDAVAAHNLYCDEDEGRRKKHGSRRKMIRTTSLTQQPKFKQKFVALLKRFKVSDEALASGAVCQTQETEEDIDLLYDSLEAYNRSDSELDDSDSIQSTPRPTLRPFFECIPVSNMTSEDGQKTGQTDGQMTMTETLSSGGRGVWSQEEPGREQDEEIDDVVVPDATTKLCKTESLTHISSRSGGSVGLHHRKVSLKERQNSRGTERTNSLDSETSTDSRNPAAQVVRKSVLDQLNNILFSDDHLPDSIILINTTDWQGQYLSEVLFDQPIVCTASAADVQGAFSAVLSRIQRYCNCSSQAPPPVKVVVGGDQTYLSSILCCFVEQLANKTPDWLNYIRFLILPVGVHPLARYVSSLDACFAGLFADASWRELFSRHEPPYKDSVDVARRVSQYLSGAAVTHLCPISEAMLAYKHRSREEDSYQTFVPFIGLVKVGIVEHTSVSTSVDSDDFILGSPPQAGAPISTSTPPTSPSTSCQGEVMCLQLDYWSHQGGGVGGERKKEAGMKNTLKSNFRCLQVSRLCRGDLMTMTVVTKEKNKKVMFLSKKMKEKEAESRSQVIEGISRLICTSKHQHTLRVSVDGVEHSDVKFFQLSAQWPTHVKHFPVGIFGYNKA